MVLVAPGVAEVVLGVVDDRVVPVSDVDGPIRSDLAVDGPEVRVLGGDQGRKNVCRKARSTVRELVAYDRPTLESAGKQLPADIFGQVGARSEVSPALFFSTDQVIEPDPLAAVAGRGRKIVDTRIIHEEGLPPFGKDVPPWVTHSYAGKNPQVSCSRVVLVNPSVVITNHSVGRFHLGVQKNSFLEIDPAARPSPPGADRMVAVFDAKTGQGQFLDVRDVIPVRILEKENIRCLGHEATPIGQFDPRRHIQSIGKDGGFVCPAIPIEVFENDDLVIGDFPRLELWVGPRAGNPETTSVVPGHMDGVGQHGLLGKEVDLVPGK